MVERWIDILLNRSFSSGRESTEAIFALSQLARYAGDRSRDLPDSVRQQVLHRLEQLGADETGAPCPSASITSWNPPRKSLALGDALPIGLRLREETE